MDKRLVILICWRQLGLDWQPSLAIEFNTFWPSLATELFNLATKLGQQIVQLGGQAPLAVQSCVAQI
jgi:hypothetical protein